MIEEGGKFASDRSERHTVRVCTTHLRNVAACRETVALCCA